ncbi:WD40/YVTN/BNR-like repeat-containing protein [Algoriphagus sediminis]|uniref:Glycosyl hydrolase n=1 Tax=Algoriphagus sediminis TaxID=3057113 RepID=A0ABT7YBU5_9BACT|nr:sialidase family protein [Algoriphagus sediminis]MDN3204007.1 glycosyl hydrolase [Algoriphagus sediminis]
MRKFYQMILCLTLLWSPALAQKNNTESSAEGLAAQSFSAFAWRNIGPAFTSGRIADIAIHPNNRNVWYVGVASGGVWKTENAGTTWTPIFDNQSVFAIGCVTIDPNNTNRIWVGTGENNGGRHISFGDGVYLSENGGSTWKNMGLKDSQHIGKIIVHPENSNVVMVASQGPLWSSGGDRGFYLSEDGGKTWEKTLGDEEWTGVGDAVIDPRNPDIVYAATWQRHRTIAGYLGGGPKSGVHKSMDGGKTWTELTNGIPGGIKGKIGLAISPQNPDYVYAAIELIRRTGGVFMSSDQGASWTKMSDAVAGATGPHYYQEVIADPHRFGAIYLIDVRMQVSYDHGKTFNLLDTDGTHSDSHSLNFIANEPDFMLLGTDGGIYETLDGTKNWRYIKNLPVTQYYKVAVDDAVPFYNVYGGTQDNGSHGGPSRTDDENGIRNAHWSRVLGGDGHQSAVEPGNPEIGYAESQQGYLNRLDRITGEAVYIQPQPGANEGEERFNWDSPILPSQHVPSTIYFASQRVWKSTDRGDSWTAISGDLTTGRDRITEPIMGKNQSWDHAWDMYAMSEFSTISSLGESPINPDVLYAGTDDGLIQYTTDGGETWNEVQVGSIPGVPENAFVNDIRADLFDEATVYVVLDNHKEGDFKPYVAKSTNYGASWSLITNGLPEPLLTWRIVQDHEKEGLLFLATEFGVYFSINGGGNWMELNGGLPTISFRDITIQRRENDLVGASFGRGFFILDDYSPLREISEEMLEKDAHLFTPRDGYWYIPRNVVRQMGDDYWSAPNPDFGVTFSYFLKEGMSTMKADRQKAEKEMGDASIEFPGFDAIEAEMMEKAPELHIDIYDSEENLVQRVKAKNASGIHRMSWDLSMASQGVINPERLRAGGFGGMMALPGTYSAKLVSFKDGEMTPMGEPVSFEIKPLREGALEGKSLAEIKSFRAELVEFANELTLAETAFEDAQNQVQAMQVAVSRSGKTDAALVKDLHDAEMALKTLESKMNGNLAKRELQDNMAPTVTDRLYAAYGGAMGTYGPTGMQKEALAAGKVEFAPLKTELEQMTGTTIPSLAARVKALGAPPIDGLK